MPISESHLDRYQTALNRLTNAIRDCRSAGRPVPRLEHIIDLLEGSTLRATRQELIELAEEEDRMAVEPVYQAAHDCDAVWFALDPKDRDTLVDWKDQFHIAAGDAVTK